MTLVSVLIPCYNAVPWIATTLESVFAQEGVELDVVVVDDGSTDGSLAAIERYAGSGVRVFSQANRGLGAARNATLRHARGDFFQYLDADDLLGPRKIREQLDCLAANPPGRVAISRTVHFLDGTPPTGGTLDDNGPWMDSDDPADWLIELLGPDGHGGMVQPAAYLVPRDVAARAGPSEEFRAYDGDGEYFGRVILASSGVVRTEPTVSYYRKFTDRSSLSGGKSAELHEGALRSLDLRRAALLAVRDSPRARRALARAYFECAILAYPAYPGVTRAALERVGALGGVATPPVLGGRALHMLRDLLGWKAARRLSVYWGRLKRAPGSAR